MGHRKDVGGLRSPHEDNDEIMRNLGIVVSLWGSVCHLVRSAATTISGRSAEDVEAEMRPLSGEDAKIKYLIGIVDDATDPRLKKLRAILTRLQTLSVERNLLIHGGPFWGARKGEFEVDYHVINYRAKGRMPRYENMPKLLDRHIAKLRSLGGYLFDEVFPKLPVLDTRGNVVLDEKVFTPELEVSASIGRPQSSVESPS
ncbi:hypothetical protein [Sinorhizobium meliloti]|uniref:hypothetical protein n=1 Tax=Rhizobium meliloti TaxID=382 RepID=UPI000FDBF9E8|nr:hypothetical protein [Sinorhizobium meliloti]RVK59171.1 hypothetical protein CN162_07760 [Sinorhizobium meliloti]RVM76213.1 hypothetical protein CN126_14425 [Sinorhizobium meliloti]RVM95309.1 hypothetical protein CN122_06465 [Sinorhizobium meliloti]RVN74725.1 hypothetical protein CN110_09200 [Sinorhizobium meliloti]RVP88290.1 hypothetical protein CN096_34265 [Sinorhizobium meliloti]